MRVELTAEQREDRARFAAFVDDHVAPRAGDFDRDGALPREVVGRLAAAGFLGATLPEEHGGSGMDMVTYGLLNEALGRGCSSVRSLITVHNMSATALMRWGSDEQVRHWLPLFATGRAICAFGLTEPGAGSDANGIECEGVPSGDSFVLNGRKKWITFGQIADAFLIFAKIGGAPAAFLVEADRPGLATKPLAGLLGCRGSMLAEVVMEDCEVPACNLVGRAGFGISHIAGTALDQGRYSVAWGCVGMIQGCLRATAEYVERRRQFGSRLEEFQLIQKMMTDMMTDLRAARLLCCRAGYLRDRRDPGAITETAVAKYFASRAAARAADAAVQAHGANGCGEDYPVQRYLRDAKVMEIIEGSTQIQQTTIAQSRHYDSPF